jgi:excisionase family DNA binding protein
VDRRLLNVEELSELTGLSKNTIYCWVSQRRIPFVKCGRLTKFDLEKIEKWIEEHTVEEKEFD